MKDAKDLLDASIDPQLQEDRNLSYLAAGDVSLDLLMGGSTTSI